MQDKQPLPCGEPFFFLLKKESIVLREQVRLGPSIPVEAMTAMVGLHMMADSGSSASSSSSSENNVGNDALFVIGLHGWRHRCPLLTRLGGGIRAGLDSKRVLFVKGKAANDRSF